MADEGRCVPGRARGCGQRQEGRHRPAALGTSLAWEPRFTLRRGAALPQRQRGWSPPRCPPTARPKAQMPQPFQKGRCLRAARHPGDLQPRAPGSPCSQHPAGQVGHKGTRGDMGGMGGHGGTPATLQLMNASSPVEPVQRPPPLPAAPSPRAVPGRAPSPPLPSCALGTAPPMLSPGAGAVLPPPGTPWDPSLTPRPSHPVFQSPGLVPVPLRAELN